MPVEILTSVLPQARAGRSVRLINTYRGIPIDYEATILVQGKDFLKVGVNKYQAVCLQLFRQTCIQFTGLPLLSARVPVVDLAEETAVLAGFSLADHRLIGRNAIRVEPKKPIPLALWRDDPGRVLPAELVDISGSGMGAYVFAARPGTGASLPREQEIHIHLSLPGDQGVQARPVTVRARLAYYQYALDLPYTRLGFQLLPDADSKPLIARYVAERQGEIIREVKALYALLRQLVETSQSISFRTPEASSRQR